MSIKKVKGLESEFSIVPNSTINDSLSWAAKGVLTYLGSKPADWEVSIQELINHSKKSKKPTGKDGTYTIVNELIEKGYIRRVQARDAGKFGNSEYVVSLSPCAILPDTDLPDTVEPDTANPTQQRTESNKEQIARKKVLERNNLIDAGFTYFWSNMGLKKVGDKTKTRASFKTQCGKDDPMLFAKKLVEDTKARIKHGQYGFESLHPRTYINGKRWENELQLKMVDDISQPDRDYSAKPATWGN